jgi:hypothetical protein
MFGPSSSGSGSGGIFGSGADAPAPAAPTPAAPTGLSSGTDTSGFSLPSLSSFNSGSVDSFLAGSSEFLNSNSMVAKFSFLLLVLLGFIILLRLGISVVSIFLAPDMKPMLVNGLIDASESKIITQDPSIKGSIPLTRSVNQDGGIENTWSIWFFIRDVSAIGDNDLMHIFHKGDNVATYSKSTDPILRTVGSNTSPGVFFEKVKVLISSENAVEPNVAQIRLKIAMNKFNTSGGSRDVINIDNIPVRKWINLIIKTRNTTVDVYINGQLTKRQTMKGIPSQNYGNVYVAQNGGFAGNISDLQYFNYAVGTSEIQDIVTRGPNLSTSDDSLKTLPRYLSSKWYFDN